MILYYQGEGVNRRCIDWLLSALFDAGYTDICPVHEGDLCYEEWESEADLLIFPGGRDVPYERSLRGGGHEKIIEYVKHGGKYLGICAGSYFASSEIEFEKGGPLEIIEKRSLSFFPGLARGPAYGLGEYSYETTAGERIAPLELSHLRLANAHVYYKGGPTFIDAEKYPNVKILGRFKELPNKPAAIISCSVGQGCALLSSVHPEADLPHRTTESQSLFEELLSILLPFAKEKEDNNRSEAEAAQHGESEEAEE